MIAIFECRYKIQLLPSLFEFEPWKTLACLWSIHFTGEIYLTPRKQTHYYQVILIQTAHIKYIEHTVKTVFFACHLFCEFCDLGDFAEITGANMLF